MNTERKLYQWDTGQKLVGCTGLYVDFPIGDEVYRVETADGMCIIPDELLQTSGSHKVYECMTNNTIRSFGFSVTPRPQPPDYVFTPTERLTFEGLVQKVDDAVADMIRRAESGEFDGHTPVKGTDYFTTSEIQQIQNEVSSGAIGEFKSVVDTETETFNTNAETKFNAYNQNDSQKFNAYNTNASNKVREYNTNAENKTAEFDTHTEQIQTDISELKSDLIELRDKSTKNLATGKDVLDGYYAGYVEPNDIYCYIKEIPVVANQEYKINASARFVAFLDNEKTYTDVKIANVTYFTPSVDGYVNVSFEKKYFNNIKIFLGEYDVVDVEDYGVYTLTLKVQTEFEKEAFRKNNLFIDAELRNGYFTSYEDSTNTNYKYYKEIPVKKGVTYVVNNRCKYASFLDINKGYVSKVEEVRFFTSPIDGYVNVTLYANSIENSKMFLLGLDVSEVSDDMEKEIPSVEYINNSNNVSRNQNPLFKKKWAVCGDSFSNGDFSGSSEPYTIEDGIYKGKNKVYGYLIGNRNLMNIQHMAVGGRTMATPQNITSHNCFSDADSDLNYMQIDSDVDYITLYFGINDSHNAPASSGSDGETLVGEIPLGTINDTTTNTFCGAYNVVLSYLIENHPNAHIGIIVSNGCDSDDYRVATIEIAKKWGIPYIDLNGDERTPMMIRSTNSEHSAQAKLLINQKWQVNYGVNGHPSAKCHEFESTIIENWLKTI